MIVELARGDAAASAAAVVSACLDSLVYADEALIVLDKPTGMLSVPGRGPDKQDCLCARVQQRYTDALIVHRLDMATSGLMVMARGALAQRRLGMAFARREVGKRYVAVVAGRPEPACAEIHLPLAADWPNRPRQQVDHERGKPSVTRYRALHYDAATHTTRVELEPLTGRSHQLRVHLQAIGHPILGDMLYAPPPLRARADRLLLHSQWLSIRHPLSGETVVFTSSAPF